MLIFSRLHQHLGMLNTLYLMTVRREQGRRWVMASGDEETGARLTLRQMERTRLLAAVTTLVENDDRIVAAWLFGSGHRGDADAFSDIDLWTVVADKQINDLVEDRHRYVQQVGQPLLALDVPGNAPIGGSYLMLQYPGPVGPLQVDWYWQPHAQAAIPDDAHLLFDRVGLSRAVGTKSIDVCYLSRGVKPPSPATAPTVVQQLMHELTFFWCMALIAAKDVARHEQEAAGWMLLFVAQKLDKAVALVQTGPTASYADQIMDPATLSLTDTMSTLQHLHMVAKELLLQLTTLGGVMPRQLTTAIHQFFDLAQATSQVSQPRHLVRRA